MAADMTTPADMLAFEDARQRILDATRPIEASQTVSLAAAQGRILATDIVAPINVPAATNSAVDGYAVAAVTVETGTAAPQIGTAQAGHPFDGPVGPGNCVRIMTGAWLPDGTDTVIMQEQAQSDDNAVSFDQIPNAGSNARPAGDDVGRGDQVLSAGAYLRASDIAVLATIGTTEVTVYRRPRVAYFSTGDELRPPGSDLGPGELFDSNRPMLAALLADLGVEAIDLGHVPDDPDVLRRALEHGRQADAIVSTGGVSVGDADYVRDVVSAEGSVDFWRVAVKPGKPLAFGHVASACFFGLPGNPVSAAVTFLQLVRPALAKLAGGQPAAPQHHQRQLDGTINRKPGRTEFMRAVQRTGDDGAPRVWALNHQGSGVLSAMRTADCLIVLDTDCERVEADTMVTVEPLAQRIWP